MNLRYICHRIALWLLPLTFSLGLAACGKAPPATLPPPPAETVIAKVPVPVPCEITQVPQPSYPAVRARPTDDIFTLAKLAAADRQTRIAETLELRAANTTPCPGGTK